MIAELVSEFCIRLNLLHSVVAMVVFLPSGDCR
jgi:hypothetical protein